MARASASRSVQVNVGTSRAPHVTAEDSIKLAARNPDQLGADAHSTNMSGVDQPDHGASINVERCAEVIGGQRDSNSGYFSFWLHGKASRVEGLPLSTNARVTAGARALPYRRPVMVDRDHAHVLSLISNACASAHRDFR